MKSLLQLLPDSQRAGVYQSALDAEEVIAAAVTAGLQVHRIDLGKAAGKSGLFDALAQAFKFPSHFGRNWDALNDCLSDLSWLPAQGYVILLTSGQAFATDHENDFILAVELLQGVAESWQARGKPFWVLVQRQAGWSSNLPSIELGQDC